MMLPRVEHADSKHDRKADDERPEHYGNEHHDEVRVPVPVTARPQPEPLANQPTEVPFLRTCPLPLGRDWPPAPRAAFLRLNRRHSHPSLALAAKCDRHAAPLSSHRAAQLNCQEPGP